MQDCVVSRSMTRSWRRGPEKRQGISRLLAQALDIVKQPLAENVRRMRLERDIGYLLKARSVSIREEHGSARPNAVREGPGVVTAPLPGFLNPGLVLEVRAEQSDLDAWARQLLSDVVRIASLVLSVETDTITADPGTHLVAQPLRHGPNS